jgi:hypothetical protein
VKWTGQELQIRQKTKVVEDIVDGEHVDEASESDDEDHATLVRSSSSFICISVSDSFQLKPHSPGQTVEMLHSITLSPSYCVPVLWIQPTGSVSLADIPTLLSPPHLREAVSSVGVLGGISQAVCRLDPFPAHTDPGSITQYLGGPVRSYIRATPTRR